MISTCLKSRVHSRFFFFKYMIFIPKLKIRKITNILKSLVFQGLLMIQYIYFCESMRDKQSFRYTLCKAEPRFSSYCENTPKYFSFRKAKFPMTLFHIFLKPYLMSIYSMLYFIQKLKKTFTRKKEKRKSIVIK